jgi:hypothetical protein
MSTFTLSKTERNKPLLLSKSFSYTIDKATNDKTYWKCEHARIDDRTFEKIPDKLAITKTNNQFLQYDSGPGDDRIIIFSSLEQL